MPGTGYQTKRTIRINWRWSQSLLAAATLLLIACSDTVRTSYRTAADARADGAVLRGWLPQELPNSAFAIAESHDLDLNTGNGSFRFEDKDADSFRAKLQPAPARDVQQFRNPEGLQRDGYTFHVVSRFVLAVNWQTRHVRFVLNFKSP